MAVTPEVQEALEELAFSFPDATITHHEDGQGGAFVRVDPLPLGKSYSVPSSWIGFHLTMSYPEAQVYPHYCVPGLTRSDGTPLRPDEGFQQTEWTPTGKESYKEPATQISRSSNRWDPAHDTAASKLHRVLEWLQS
jgi:hypothetical protein